MPTEQYPPHFGLGPRLSTSTSNGLHATNGQLALLLGDPPCSFTILWQVGYEAIAEKSEGNSDDTVHNE
jgi:hypothetical protein